MTHSETRTEAYIDGIWYTIARNRMTYNAEGKRTSLENLAGQVTTTAWDCCHKVSYSLLGNDPVNKFDLRGLDAPGCDIVGAMPGWESDCRLRCCAKHDECYDKNKCSAWSWFNLLNPFTCPTRCDDCNIEVVFCTEQCFSGHDNPPRPWDRPKPNGGKYYCATLHKYIADPNDCPKKSNE